MSHKSQAKVVSLKQRLMRISYFTVVIGVVIVTASFIAMGSIQRVKTKYQESVGLLMILDDGVLAFNGMTASLQRIFDLMKVTPGEEKGIIASNEEMMGTVGEVQRGAKNSELKRVADQLHERLSQKIIPAIQEAFISRQKGTSQGKQVFLSKVKVVLSEESDLLETARTLAMRDVNNFGKQQNQYLQAASWVLLSIIGLGFFGVFLYCWRVASSVSGTLQRVAQDLEQRAETIRAASGSMASVSVALSKSTTQQAAAIEETVASMEEMTSMIEQTSHSSNSALSLVEIGHAESQQGREVIGRLVQAMEVINHSNEKLGSLVKIIDEIRKKASVINDIVFRTRLLSFNASIEAARAGTHGKGFAVVAEEVGKLAAVSGNAATEIDGLLESSVSEVAKIVGSTQESVAQGRDITKEAENSFSSMSLSLGKISDAIASINGATQEQQGGVREANKAMQQMDMVTQANARSSEDVEMQAKGLANEAGLLGQLMASLNQVLFGAKPQAKVQDKAPLQEERKDSSWNSAA